MSICWWDINGPSKAHDLKTLREWCALGDDAPANDAFDKPLFCTYECAYAFMKHNHYSDQQLSLLLCVYPSTQKSPVLQAAHDPYILKHPFNGTQSDIDEYRAHKMVGLHVPFAQRMMYKHQIDDILLEQYKERKALLDKVTQK